MTGLPSPKKKKKKRKRWPACPASSVHQPWFHLETLSSMISVLVWDIPQNLVRWKSSNLILFIHCYCEINKLTPVYICVVPVISYCMKETKKRKNMENTVSVWTGYFVRMFCILQIWTESHNFPIKYPPSKQSPCRVRSESRNGVGGDENRGNCNHRV